MQLTGAKPLAIARTLLPVSFAGVAPGLWPHHQEDLSQGVRHRLLHALRGPERKPATDISLPALLTPAV